MDRRTRYSYLFAASVVVVAVCLTARDRDLRQVFVRTIGFAPFLDCEDLSLKDSWHSPLRHEVVVNECDLAIECHFDDQCDHETPTSPRGSN